METLINPEILIQDSIKNKQRKYYITYDKKISSLCIKSRGYKGESRGVIGKILKTGEIVTQNEFIKDLITPQIKEKINFTISLLFNPEKQYQTTQGRS